MQRITPKVPAIVNRSTIGALVAVIGLTASPDVAAQSTAAPPTSAAGWQNGFVIQSADGSHRVTFGAVVQVDGKFTPDNPPAFVDTFTLRKARLIVAGRVARHFDFRIVPDFGNGTTALLDANFDVRFSPAFRVRVGKDKTPVGYELLLGDAALLFPERALASSLVPNRDVGVAVQGDVRAGAVSYAAGVFNGVADGTSSTTDIDSNGGKDVAGRLAAHPFRLWRPTSAGPLAGLGIHIGASHGEQAGTLPSFRTSAGQTYFSYAPAGSGLAAVTASGARTRVAPAVFYYYKGLGAFGEYVRTTQAVARGGDARTLAHHGWAITGAYLLTGEAAGPGLPTPRRPFDPPTRTWGALQVLARYSTLALDDDTWASGFAAANASNRARQFTVGLNWYPATVVKYYLTYERTSFQTPGQDVRPVEHAIFFRLQLAF